MTALAFLSLVLCPQELSSPDEFFGHRLAADRKIVSHDQVLSYLEHLAGKSDRIRLIELGKSTLDNRFVLAVLGTPGNVKQAEGSAAISKKLFEGRVDEAEARGLAGKAKALVLMTFNIHSTEVATSQTPPELAYRVVTGKIPMDDVILLMVSSINPDGQLMIKEWYDKYVGTEFEGGPMPKLYHIYCGHDNNRDGFMLNLAETRHLAKLHYKTWFPQIAVDHHQMGSTGGRMWVPPYAEPLNPEVHPLVHRWLNVIGTHMAMDLERSGRTGVQSQRRFEAYWPGATDSTPWWHNRIGILTESASARIATPLFVDPSEAAATQESVTQPRPWKGGWWRIRDIVDQELTASETVLRIAGRYKEQILLHTWRMGRDAIRKGETEGPFAYVIPAKPHDPSAVRKLMEMFLAVGVEIHLAGKPFRADFKEYPAGTVIIPLAQPDRPYIKNLFSTQRYPLEARPYDVAGWTLPYQMGFRADAIRERFSFAGRRLEKVPDPGSPTMRPGDTAMFRHVNRWLAEGKAVYRTTKASSSGPAGTYLREAGEDRRRLRPVRLGLYQPWRPSMDEGWTRLVLENFEFTYETLHNEDMKKEDLRESFDVILIPDVSTDIIRDGRTSSEKNKPERYPPEFQGGIGKDGKKALKSFVEKGGTLLFLDSSCDYAIDEWGLPVRNVLKGDSTFSCPGSILKAKVDASHPLGFGMPENAYVYFHRSPALQTSIPRRVDVDRRVVVRYGKEESALASGYMNQPDKLKGRSALVDFTVGKGRIVLFAFRVQHRAQAWGTFRMLFNAIQMATAEEGASR